ncbi:olfactory receptor 10C1-like [Terrapene carolina triunguis]|uniref:olfactory receptor 10C1-like n=1 Tax=Terrapene triunguis TaxID=2587831 RepID=UPI00115627E1|nr:olfactory receptor 10C1-like [Terrapene carolina triunguis]
MKYPEGIRENHTSVTEFIILGFSNLPHMERLLFLLFICIYFITVLGNILILILINVDPALHAPMYFFLRNLSFLEICYTSVTLPKMMANLLSEDKTISFVGCAAQMYFFLLLGATECCLLAVMAYDRYSAICNPLRYAAIMNKTVCVRLAAGSWICGSLVALGHTTFIFTLPFCGSNVINHFFCEIQPVLTLVCGDTSWNEFQIIVAAAFIIMMPFLLILVSYIHIISTILKMSSAKGRHRAFSTCSSHLTVVVLFYGTAVFIYIRPKSSYSLDVDKLLSLFYSVVTPILNPIIYSLRNKDVKGAIRRMGIKIFPPISARDTKQTYTSDCHFRLLKSQNQGSQGFTKSLLSYCQTLLGTYVFAVQSLGAYVSVSMHMQYGPTPTI